MYAQAFKTKKSQSNKQKFSLGKAQTSLQDIVAF